MTLSRLCGVKPSGMRIWRDVDDEKRITIICRLHNGVRERGCGGDVWVGNGARDVDEGQGRRTFLLSEERDLELVAVIDSGPKHISEESANDGPFLWQTLSKCGLTEVLVSAYSLSPACSMTSSLSVMVNLDAFEPSPKESEGETMVDGGCPSDGDVFRWGAGEAWA